jgi:hypothetical protein
MTLRLALWVTVWTSALGAQAPAGGPLARVEFAFQQARYWDDQLRLVENTGVAQIPTGVPRAAAEDSFAAATARFTRELTRVPARGLSDEDHRALAVMRRALRRRPTEDHEESRQPSCDPRTQDSNTLDPLMDATMACYGAAQERIVVGEETLDRLTILGRISRTADPARRRELFLALEPIWRSVNGDNEPASPYRRLLRLRREAWRGGSSPPEQTGAAFGLAPAELERWVERGLEAWRLASPDTLLEPWDWYHWTGGAGRALGPRIPSVDDLGRVDRSYYRQIGADPERLGIRHDLEPRPGKYAVAYTDFGARGRWDGAGRFLPAEPWIFATYRTGGLDNLAELLHETGHAIHLAALHTRPAFLDWPDSDTFTEALADLPALELYEPAWQQRFLGDSVPVGVGLRARYAGVVLDLAWALFELRVHAAPDADPNVLWTDITSRYLRIAPHPEWSWWAMRGQLVDAPGYIINYALGAFITADLRARVRELRGEFAWCEPDTYPWLSDRLYRFGLERSSRRVLQEFLGRPLRPDAMLRDLHRLAR